jgi:hypothetical protein
MNSKLFLSLLAIIAVSNNAEAGKCIFGVCSLTPRQKVIVAHRVINPLDRIVTGYKVSPSRISLMIHLTSRHPSLYVSNPIFKGRINYISFGYFRANGFTTNLRYGGDNVNLSLMDGSNFVIDVFDYKGKHHIIRTKMPHSVSNLIGRVEIKLYGNTIEVSMPRF